MLTDVGATTDPKTMMTVTNVSSALYDSNTKKCHGKEKYFFHWVDREVHEEKPTIIIILIYHQH
jgi:hypothetical protein